MKTIQDITAATTSAMKAGDKERVQSLRFLSNEVKKIAKEDGNREPTADDVVKACRRLEKQIGETLSYVDEGVERKRLQREQEVMREFLPTKMSKEILLTKIDALLVDAPEGKAARGHVMKTLKAEHNGEFDPADVMAIMGQKGY
jgi:uncharacterized protein